MDDSTIFHLNKTWLIIDSVSQKLIKIHRCNVPAHGDIPYYFLEKWSGWNHDKYEGLIPIGTHEAIKMIYNGSTSET